MNLLAFVDAMLTRSDCCGFVVTDDERGERSGIACSPHNVSICAEDPSSRLVVIDAVKLGPPWIVSLRRGGTMTPVLCIGRAGAAPSAADMLLAGANDFIACPYEV